MNYALAYSPGVPARLGAIHAQAVPRPRGKPVITVDEGLRRRG